MKRSLLFSLVILLTAVLTAGATAQDIKAMEQHMATIAETVRQSIVRVSAERSWPKTGGEPFTASYSGVIWDDDGHIVTAAEAALGVAKVRVETVDGRCFDAKVLGVDDVTNTAVIQADVKDLKPLPHGDSSTVRIGHWVLAVGNPFGFMGSVSYGIVSGVGRQIERNGKPLWNMIQITAPINPGDTGGAVVNSRGEMIGMIHSTYGRAPSMESFWLGTGLRRHHVASSTVAAEGINFAMPINTLKPIVEQVIQHGEVRRGWLGVAIQTITPAMSEPKRQGLDTGVVVARVLADSPAVKAGIEPGDALTLYDGQDIKSTAQLIQMVTATRPGKSVEIKGRRAGNPVSFSVTVDQAPKSKPDFQAMMDDLMPLFPNGWLGVHVENVTPEHGGKPDVPHGAVVVEVLPGSPAERMGLSSGDVILKLNDKEIHNALELKQRVLSRSPEDIANGVFKMEVQREGKRVSISSK
ncbi:MAG: PDZ domain-containing protein [Planctomycetes bacterium]|nr:PDZ domain-containing protein [Planctomycetota bacterium]